MLGNRSLAVYIITDSTLSHGRSHVEVAREAIRGGADVIQFREKNMNGRDLIATARELQDLCRQAGVLFLVNDRVDVALAVDADGVHVGQEDMPADIARRLIGPDKVLGVSTRTPELALKAQQDGADYVGTGAIYATTTKNVASGPRGPELIDRIKQVVSIPVVAIGGITVENAPECILHGADGCAVISAVVGAPDIADATRRLHAAIEGARGR